MRKISLPRACEPHPVDARGTAGKPPGGETILLIEDDELDMSGVYG